MKFLKYWIYTAILCMISAISFCMGRNYESYYYNVDNLFEVNQQLKDSCEKHYEAACLMSDFIRYSIDHFTGETECFDIGVEIENSYEDFFGGLEIGDFKTSYIKHIKDFDNYSWCY